MSTIPFSSNVIWKKYNFCDNGISNRNIHKNAIIFQVGADTCRNDYSEDKQLPQSQFSNEIDFSKFNKNLNLFEFDEKEATSEQDADLSFDLVDEVIKVLMEPISSQQNDQQKDLEPRIMEYQEDSTDSYIGMQIVNDFDEDKKIREEQRR